MVLQAELPRQVTQVLLCGLGVVSVVGPHVGFRASAHLAHAHLSPSCEGGVNMRGVTGAKRSRLTTTFPQHPLHPSTHLEQLSPHLWALAGREDHAGVRDGDSDDGDKLLEVGIIDGVGRRDGQL